MKRIKDEDIIVLGAGIGGLSAAFFLKEKLNLSSLIFEAESEWGGLCRSYIDNGNIWDYSGHLLHFREKENFELVNKLLNGYLQKHQRRAFVYFSNKYIPYPLQAYLNLLPEKVKKSCWDDFYFAPRKNLTNQNVSFDKWLENYFGKALCKLFLFPYNKKFWHIPLNELSCSWANRFIFIPPKDILATDYCQDKFGYHAEFYYPSKGGISRLADALAKKIGNINLNSRVEKINLQNKEVVFSSGSKYRFNLLISTIPLPELRNILCPLPSYIDKLLAKLRWITIDNLNICLRKKNFLGWHWIYYPDKDIPFFRLGFFHNINPSQKQGSIYIDISRFGKKVKYKNKDISTWLKKLGIIDNSKDILSYHCNVIKYAYPIVDKNYISSVPKIRKWLEKQGIFLAGRFGYWDYFSMEDTINFSRNLVNRISRLL